MPIDKKNVLCGLTFHIDVHSNQSYVHMYSRDIHKPNQDILLYPYFPKAKTTHKDLYRFYQ